MRNRIGPILGVVTVVVVPLAAIAQSTQPSSDTVTVLIQEIRLLRRALEKQSWAAARAQLLIGRLTLQDQRAARARQSVEQLENELRNAERDRDQMRIAARDTAESLGRVTDEERREQLERQAKMLGARLADYQTDISQAQSHLVEAKQTLDTETARYEELETLFRDLDRQLQGGQ